LGRARAAVSLHGHTNRSKESLRFILEWARKAPMLHEALQKQCKRARIHVDFSRAYWTPPLTPELACETEKDQIERGLGLKSLISLTDHDTIEAPLLLRDAPQTARMPISLEWSVPFQGAIFHLGVHNLPERRAQGIMGDLAAYTRQPDDQRLLELLEMLDRVPNVLVVFNHPLWTQTCLGVQRKEHVLDRFLGCAVEFLHAFEINGVRSRKENQKVGELASRWERPLVAGGDRHGCAASNALNLTRAECFCEFVSEIRDDQRSHVLLMPPYNEPVSVRVTRTLLDVIRHYPQFPHGSQRWDDRVFHPGEGGGVERPISTLWKKPPAFVERILSCIRLAECGVVEGAARRIFREAGVVDKAVEELPAPVATEAVSTEALL
jgi:hypothetical protein